MYTRLPTTADHLCYLYCFRLWPPSSFVIIILQSVKTSFRTDRRGCDHCVAAVIISEPLSDDRTLQQPSSDYDRLEYFFAIPKHSRRNHLYTAVCIYTFIPNTYTYNIYIYILQYTRIMRYGVSWTDMPPRRIPPPADPSRNQSRSA